MLIDRGCIGEVVISGRSPQVVDESQVVKMLDSLSLDNGEDRSSDNSDSDTSGDVTVSPPPLCQSNTSAVPCDTSESVQKDEKRVVEEASSLDSGLSSREIKWNNLDRFQRGLFKNCVVDMSATVQSAQTTTQELPSSCDNNSIQTVPNTCNSHDLPRKVAEELTTLERVKKCMYEWKTTELVEFLCRDPTTPKRTGISGNISSVEEGNRNGTENNMNGREETVKLYERKVGEFYGAKPRVRFANSCKQVSIIMCE